MNKLFFSLVLLTLIAGGCDDRLSDLPNTPPKILFSGENISGDYVDSLKIGLSIKSGTIFSPYYTVNLTGTDFESKIKSVTFSVVSGSADFYVNQINTKLVGNVIPLDNSGNATVYIKAQPGQNVITLTDEDGFGATTTVTLHIFAFLDLPPIAKVVFTSTKIKSPYQYQFDGSPSYDQDRDFGGSVSAYQYVINDVDTVLTANPKIPFIFNGPGGYVVKYRVYDNEGVTSPWVTAPTINF